MLGEGVMVERRVSQPLESEQAESSWPEKTCILSLR